MGAVRKDQRDANAQQEGFIARLSELYDSLTAQGKRVADFYLYSRDPEKTAKLSIQDVAGSCGVGVATVSRLVSKMGISGFKAFQVEYARSGAIGGFYEPAVNDIFESGRDEDIVENVFRLNAQAISQYVELLQADEYKTAADMILRADRVMIYGLGHSAVTARSFWIRLFRMGVPCTVIDTPHEQLVASVTTDKKTLHIGISHSGRSAVVVRALEYAKKKECPTLAISSDRQSPLIKAADASVVVSIPMQAGKRESHSSYESTLSNTLELIATDSICMLVALRRPGVIERYRDSTEALEKTIRLR